MSIETINLSDSPNSGRTKINSNFSELSIDLAGKISADGTTPFTGNIDAGGNKLINLAPATAGTDGINLNQAQSVSNRIIAKNYAYVLPSIASFSADIYLDGTGDRALRVKSLTEAFTTITDSTTDNEWTILVNNHPSYYPNTDFSSLTNYMNIVATDGNAKLQVLETTPGNFVIDKSAYFYGLTFNFSGTYFRLEGDGIYEKCNIYVKDSFSNPTKISLSNVNLLGCNLIADEIELDGTSSNFIDDCRLSVDLSGTGINDPNTLNKINSNLETVLNKKITL